MKYIKIRNLKDGYLYEIDGRTASVGMWSSFKKCFLVSRFKFGDNFLFPEDHWDEGGTARALKEIEEVPWSTFLKEHQVLKYLNDKREQLNGNT